MAQQCPTGICTLPSLREREARSGVAQKTMVSKECSLIPVGGARGKGNMYATLPNAQTARGFFFFGRWPALPAKTGFCVPKRRLTGSDGRSFRRFWA
jgi:hypothetical protein